MEDGVGDVDNHVIISVNSSLTVDDDRIVSRIEPVVGISVARVTARITDHQRLGQRGPQDADSGLLTAVADGRATGLATELDLIISGGNLET